MEGLSDSMPKKTDLVKQVKPIELSNSRYINVKTDFSFKYIFGSESRKKLLIDFLNAVFKGRKVIRDLTFNNPNHKGMRKENRKTVFDVYCTDNKGGKFIVEIQQASQRFFKDRILYYSANLIREQGKSVSPDWNYRLPEVYVVALMDFSFDHTHRDQYLHDVRLMDVMTHTVFYDKLRYVFVELPKFKKSADELKTNEDGWLYSLRNMEILDEIPVPLRGTFGAQVSPHVPDHECNRDPKVAFRARFYPVYRIESRSLARASSATSSRIQPEWG